MCSSSWNLRLANALALQGLLIRARMRPPILLNPGLVFGPLALKLVLVIPVIRQRRMNIGWRDVRKSFDDLGDRHPLLLIPGHDVFNSDAGATNPGLRAAGALDDLDVLRADVHASPSLSSACL